MGVNFESERLITAATVIALSSIIGAIVGLMYGLATGGTIYTANKLRENLQLPLELFTPNRSGELALFLVSTISAVAGALADIEDIADLLAYFTAFLSSMNAAFFQNPLNLLPLLLALLPLAKTAD
jgi:hypothetical protein